MTASIQMLVDALFLALQIGAGTLSYVRCNLFHGVYAFGKGQRQQGTQPPNKPKGYFVIHTSSYQLRYELAIGNFP